LKIFTLILALLFASMAFAQSNSEYGDDEESSYEDDGLPFVEIKAVDDFNSLLKEARQNGKIILLEMSASYCGYCRTLEAEIIKPMLRSGDYDKNVLIRQLEIDAYHPINDLFGSQSSPSEMANKLGVFVTPTLLFLNGEGKEVSKRIIGINTLEYYGAYVDEALNQGLQTINKHL
jgi:thioredoxin-related protein